MIDMIDDLGIKNIIFMIFGAILLLQSPLLNFFEEQRMRSKE
jgi:hypothetical protein